MVWYLNTRGVVECCTWRQHKIAQQQAAPHVLVHNSRGLLGHFLCLLAVSGAVVVNHIGGGDQSLDE